MADITGRIQMCKDRLNNLTDLLVPTDYPRPLPARTVEEVQTHVFNVANTLLEDSKLFSVLLAAFAVLLQRYTGDEEFAVGSSSPDNNTLVLSLNVDTLEQFGQVINMVKEVNIKQDINILELGKEKESFLYIYIILEGRTRTMARKFFFYEREKETE